MALMGFCLNVCLVYFDGNIVLRKTEMPALPNFINSFVLDVDLAHDNRCRTFYCVKLMKATSCVPIVKSHSVSNSESNKGPRI
ncbi:hypothetical protein T11_8226 [Trichinella zimbabwensis]|uniref:Uncharacterized protein n=1 Tax=Trichinella zimbabwensis TaxID=268475 RepID=A0A0V1I7L9_9BILA|nr:hypothetical protein T11_8226 [Trichinella zimbabwensis]